MYMNKNTILQLYFLLKVDKTDKFKMRSFHFKFNFPKFPQKTFWLFCFFRQTQHDSQTKSEIIV